MDGVGCLFPRAKKVQASANGYFNSTYLKHFSIPEYCK
jgi:hypothetical protein